MRSTEHLWADPVVGRDLATRANELVRQRQDAPSDAIRAEQIEAAHHPERRWTLRQQGRRLIAVPVSDAVATTSSPLAEVGTRGGRLDLQCIGGSDPCFWDGVWDGGRAPSWASAWDWDDHGAWAEFAIEGRDGRSVTQRMRWIEPGSFLIGSPEDEPERYGDEGPQHEVTIRDGFWLFDTACTQALWEVALGGNPSRFKGADRPVDQASWANAQRFIEAINALVPGLALSLPSEAQWEYACRAGTATPFSFGANITPEQVNYNDKFTYAGGAEGLYRRETVPVKALAPNGWGLYQMHGNVREWVQDAWHSDYEGAPTDSSAWETNEAGAARVIRGGSWDGHARYCRSAFRSGFAPVARVVLFGFRCARAQVRESGRSEAERAGAELARPGPRSGSGRDGTDPTRGAEQDRALPRLLRLDTPATATAELPDDAPALEVRTDRETLLLYRCAKPGWASAMGRDRFGLWAEIAIEDSTGEPVVQRLRWIPPGRFLMGSPADEPGRWEDEGPQHAVTIGRGFWLFDTPCTQALWVALGLENPSRFQDPSRPVEQVSWDDIQQQFLPALNARIPGFLLPSEAQWEYACRAGTLTALYTGPIEIFGERDAPALDPIAWYGGDGGVDFELGNGFDSFEWTEVQYPNPRSGTHPVGKKQPNRWGLYDMLGNVWEWTRDVWHGSYEGAPTDGSVRDLTEAGAARVFRGGSWLDHARVCRSACRNGGVPGNRGGLLGFRCARAQV